ncbi:glycosyltransferase [Pigmentibacter sp. JX0631]|uniref:glycosyltransferase n=1 Tax=Pigmentibacter sp. JX0631 TaxID=2976982 RepID=UPI00246846B2|nr:glycosyltransferase [Pigmentibacter sp. JX0631]WGL61352.1 glycosyltransferase [Pigmentibacter sp. JX0631]
MQQDSSYCHLFLNSNPWFSAVSDYSLQLCLFLQKKEKILYCAEVGSTHMDKKCAELNIPFTHIPIHNQSGYNFFISFFSIISILIKNRNTLKFIWVFEGREHTLCCILKIILPFIFRNIKIVRVRGQAQRVSNNIFSKFVYNKLTDKIILAAKCVKNRFGFELNNKKTIIQHYCKDTLFSNDEIKKYSFNENFPVISKNKLVFLLIGRFDEVKGHKNILNSFLNADLKIDSQLILLGYKANLNINKIYSHYLEKFGQGKFIENLYFLENRECNKQVFIVENKINDLSHLLAVTSFGVIPSLESEVICRVGVEFLQSSVPTIYSSAGALGEVFRDFPEFNFKAGNEVELTKLLEKSASIFLNTTNYLNLKKKTYDVGSNKYSLKEFSTIYEFINSQ